MKTFNPKNPYSDAGGLPTENNADKFFAWARQHELKRRSSLPEEVQKKLMEADKKIDRKINI